MQMQRVCCTGAGVHERSSLAVFVGVVCGLFVLSCTSGSSSKANEGNDRSQKHTLKWTTQSGTAVPISLTASDGTGLLLRSLYAEAVVQGPLAFTELHLSFENLENRVREGHFEITLPPGAAVSRFAMKIGTKWQEAEVVERQRARRTYEDFLHRRQDPALLEKKAGNQFRARVFPIAAKAQKEIVISYSQEIHATPYTLYVAGLPRMKRFEVVVNEMITEGSPLRHQTSARNFVPRGNVVLKEERTNIESTGWTGLQNGDLRVVKVVPQFDSTTHSIESMTVLFDTSASRALGFSAQVDRISRVLNNLLRKNGHDFELVFVCFDQTVRKIFHGKASRFGEAEKKKIIARGAMGASNLDHAMAWVKRENKAIHTERVLLVSDGIITAGETATATLQQRVKQLDEIGVERVDVLVEGGIRDESLLSSVVNSGLKRAGVTIDGDLSNKIVAQRLLRNTLAEVTVKVPKARWVWPSSLKGVQSGDPQLIYIDAPANASVEIDLEGIPKSPKRVNFVHVPKPLLKRAGAIAQIDMVSSMLGGISDEQEQQQLKDQVVRLSIENRVLSDYTALLVLETERDYARYNIDRRGLTEILVVENAKVRLKSRDQIVTNRVRPRGIQKGGNSVVGTSPFRGEEGQMGKRDTRPRETRFAIRGPRDNPNPNMGQPNAESALGTLKGNQVGENFGYGGLGLSGTGRGGGGGGEGTIGLGNLNTIGHGAGGGSGSGYSRGAGGLGGRRGVAPRVRSGAVMVRGSLSREVIRRIVHRHINEVKFCYERELARTSDIEGRIAVKFIISETGAVQMSAIANSTLDSPRVENCVASVVRRWTFPQPKNGDVVIVTYPFQLTAPQNQGGSSLANRQMETPTGESRSDLPPLFAQSRERKLVEVLKEKGAWRSYEGELAEVMALLSAKKLDEAQQKSVAWRKRAPGDLLALVALGEIFEAHKNKVAAARAYGSIIDLFPSRADMRRMAGERLERLGDVARWLTVDTYKHAVKQRPDHPSSHRLYAWALFRVGKMKQALSAMKKGITYRYPSGRFLGVVKEMQNEMKIMAATWKRKDPKSAEMRSTLKHYQMENLSMRPSTRFVLHWESDANDVDLHVYDKRGNHASYQAKQLPSGGHLAADVTNGYGPEFFTIPGVANAQPYTLQAHYYSRGPMGYGMGTLHIIVDDGKGDLLFEHRPFIVMQDGAFVGLGSYEG